jgi:hypothetical protein
MSTRDLEACRSRQHKNKFREQTLADLFYQQSPVFRYPEASTKFVSAVKIHCLVRGWLPNIDQRTTSMRSFIHLTIGGRHIFEDIFNARTFAILFSNPPRDSSGMSGLLSIMLDIESSMWEAEDDFKLQVARLANRTPEERVVYEWTKSRHVPELLFKLLTLIGDFPIEIDLKNTLISMIPTHLLGYSLPPTSTDVGNAGQKRKRPELSTANISDTGSVPSQAVLPNLMSKAVTSGAPSSTASSDPMLTDKAVLLTSSLWRLHLARCRAKTVPWCHPPPRMQFHTPRRGHLPRPYFL